MDNQKQIVGLKHLLCLIVAIFAFENSLSEIISYRVIEVNDTIFYIGKPKGKLIKIGDIYQENQKINWISATQQIKVYRNGNQYIVNYKGIKKVGKYKPQQITKAECLIKREGSSDSISLTSHYSNQIYNLFGKSDILYLERTNRSKDNIIYVSIKFDEDIVKCYQIESAFDGTYYAIPAKLFHKMHKNKGTILKITEKKYNYTYNDYTQGVSIIYYP